MAESKKNSVSVSLGDNRSRALVLIFGAMAIAALGVGWFFYQMTTPEVGRSQITQAPSDVTNVMTGQEDTRMTRLLTTYDQRRASNATKQGESMMASLTAYARNAEPIPDPRTEALDVNQMDPLKKIVDVTAPKPEPKPEPEPTENTEPQEQAPTQVKKVVIRKPAPQQPQPRRNTQNINEQIGRYTTAMRSEFKAISGVLALSGGSTTVYRRFSAGGPKAATPGAGRGFRNVGMTGLRAPRRGGGRSPGGGGKTLIKAGSVAYAVTVMMANSDVPGPVMARVVSGKYRGAKLLGQYERLQDRLRLTFNKMILDGRSKALSVNAIAFQPESTSPALATDVNHHYVKRFFWPFVGGMLKGFGEAMIQGGKRVVATPAGTTVVFGEHSTTENLLIAAGGGANAIGSELQELAATPITVRVGAGTPIGVLFLSDVKSGRTTQASWSPSGSRAMMGGGAMGAMAPMRRRPPRLVRPPRRPTRYQGVATRTRPLGLPASRRPPAGAPIRGGQTNVYK